jgi:hypothetical protein
VSALQEIAQRSELGWACALLAYAERGLGHRTKAQQYVSQALEIGAETKDLGSLVYALPVMALLLADQGEKEKAAALYARVAQHPYVSNSQWFQDVAGQQITKTGRLPPHSVVAAQGQASQAGLWPGLEEFLGALGQLSSQSPPEEPRSAAAQKPAAMPHHAGPWALRQL